MSAVSVVCKDVVRALSALALFFLAFAHEAPAARYDAALTAYLPLAAPLDCAGTEDTGHAPCDACRIGGTACLPEGPVAHRPAARVDVPRVARMSGTPPRQSLRLAGAPRGPPA